MTGGEIVLGYNLPGNPKLKLPRDVYTSIFLGKIRSSAITTTRGICGPEAAGRRARSPTPGSR
jgi:hypothetical protein